MITPSAVYSVLTSYSDLDNCDTALLISEGDKGLSWVMERLKDGVDKNHHLIVQTAAAIAHYNLFMKRLTDEDKLESYKAGDITVRRNLKTELQLQKEIRNTALADAAEILKDGGFFCLGN